MSPNASNHNIGGTNLNKKLPLWIVETPMALVEILIKFLDQDIGSLDYDGEWAADDNKFSSITSFVADKESILWLRDCLSETLGRKIENAEYMVEHGASEYESR